MKWTNNVSDKKYINSYTPINVFPRRGSGGITVGNWTILIIWFLISYHPWVTISYRKYQGLALKFPYGFFCVKVFFQILRVEIIWLSDPQGIPAAPPSGENFDMCINISDLQTRHYFWKKKKILKCS